MAKATSKRKTLRQKYKIKKKVADHHRQQKKASKKAKSIGLQKRKNVERVPNSYPFKQNVLQQIAARKIEEDEEKKLKKLEKKEKKKMKSIEELAEDAASKQQDYENRIGLTEPDAPIGGSFHATDSSRKAYFREFRRVVDESDVILEVLDARDPMGCRCIDIEKFIIQRDPQKRIVLILNKIDLVPRENVQQWLAFLRKQLPTIAFKSNTQQQQQRIGRISVDLKKVTDSQLKSKECLGADTLMKLLKNYTRNIDIKTSITVGIIGYPNVGKSSLINSLKREKVAVVGATPGVTKVKQEIHLDKHIRLLDCPGIVFSTRDTTETGILLRSNSIKVNQIDDAAAAIDLIVRQCDKEKLLALYAIADFNTSREFLGVLAQKRGKVKKGGVPNYEEVARAVLNDWNAGKVPFYTIPPSSTSSSSSSSSSVMMADESTSSAIVTEWAKEFDIDALLSDEASVLDKMEGPSGAQELSGGGNSVDSEMFKETENDDSVQIAFAPIKKRKRNEDDNPKDKDEAPVTENKLRKKEQKRMKKAAAHDEKNAMDHTSEENADYNFAVDFAPSYVSREASEGEGEDGGKGEDGKEQESDGDIDLD